MYANEANKTINNAFTTLILRYTSKVIGSWEQIFTTFQTEEYKRSYTNSAQVNLIILNDLSQYKTFMQLPTKKYLTFEE